MGVLSPYGLSVACYDRLSGGAPSSTILPAETALVQRGLLSLEFSCAATFGFETARIPVRCTFDEAMALAQNHLMMGIAIYSPDGDTCWEGFVNAATIQAGDEQAAISLDGMANRVKCRYATYLGTPGVSSTVTDATSDATYGTKDLVISIGTTGSTGATNAATRKLAEVAWPRMTPSTNVQTAAGGGEVLLTLECLGWYATLDWVVTSSTTTTNTSTTTQVGSLLSTLASTNAFISTSTANIGASLVSDTEFISADTTYRQKIETLLAQGNSSGQRLVWGVYEKREFYVEAWAGANPSQIDYQRRAGEAIVRNAAGGAVPWWNVRPNRMYQRVDFLDVAPVTGQSDTLGRFAIERTTCTIDSSGVSLTLEGPQSGSADSLIARMGGN